MSLATLDAALQIIFAWSDGHLYAFRIHGKEYGCVRLGSPHFEDNPPSHWGPGDLSAAVDQLDAYLQFQAEHFDRRDVNAQLVHWFSRKEHEHEVRGSRGDHHR
jgi:hypothetical protein